MQPTADKRWPESVPLAPLPGLPLTKPLRERLRQVRERQMAEQRAGCPQLVCGEL